MAGRFEKLAWGWLPKMAPVEPPGHQRSVGALQLEPWSLDPSWVLDGAPCVTGKILTASRDGRTQTGLWECRGPATFRFDFESDETIFVLEGGADVQWGLRRTLLRPGDVSFFPAGTRTTWRVPDRLKKSFTLHAVSPARRLYRALRFALTVLAVAFGAPELEDEPVSRSPALSNG